MEQLQVTGLHVTSCKRCVFYTNRLISSLENVIFVPTKMLLEWLFVTMCSVFILLINIFSNRWKKSKSTWKRTRNAS